MKKQHLIAAMALLFMPIVSSAEGERLNILDEMESGHLFVCNKEDISK